MTKGQCFAATFLVVVACGSAAAGFLAPHKPETQFREHANEGPSRRFLLGTDTLGRDRWSRLLHASRVSLVCAPAAAGAAILIGTFIGLLAGFRSGWLDTTTSAAADLVLSIPWLFLLLTLRAVLPLNISPEASLAVTFALLSLTGWAPGARIIRGATVRLRTSTVVQYARACGCQPVRLLGIHLLPNVRPVIVAQFWILVPAFLLAEANLGILGLGVTEPMPSWGNMLAELREYDRIPEAPWILAPAVLLAFVVGSLYLLIAERRSS